MLLTPEITEELTESEDEDFSETDYLVLSEAFEKELDEINLDNELDEINQ